MRKGEEEKRTRGEAEKRKRRRGEEKRRGEEEKRRREEEKRRREEEKLRRAGASPQELLVLRTLSLGFLRSHKQKQKHNREFCNFSWHNEHEDLLDRYRGPAAQTGSLSIDVLYMTA